MKYTLTIATDDPNDIIRLLSGTAIGSLPGAAVNTDDDDTGPAVAIQPGEVDATGPAVG